VSARENLPSQAPAEPREDAFTRRSTLIPCEQDDVIVDWSSGVLKTNVGESNVNMTSEFKDGRVPSRVRAREEEMLGEYFVLPPGTPPSSQWRVLDDCAVVPGGNCMGLPSIVLENKIASSMEPAKSLVAGREPVHDKQLVLPSFVQDQNSSSMKPAKLLVAGREPVHDKQLVLPSFVQDQNSSSLKPAKLLVAGREPVHDKQLVLPSFVQDQNGGECASDQNGGECASFSPNECAATPLAVSSLKRDLVAPESADWPRDLIGEIKRILRAPNVAPRAPSFQFQMDEESAQNNFLFLERHELDLSKALRAQQGSPLDYGSEFKPVEALECLFGLHPNWKRMKKILEEGSEWPMDELDPESRLSDLEDAIAFGNHKGATKNEVLLKKLVEKDVTHGYGLVLPLDKMKLIPGVLMAPMNIMNQNTINETGQIIGKDRLTHDQSYKWGSETSVNSRVRKEELLPCRFGACIKRIVNWAVAARRKYPDKRILVSKIDYKSAYRRCHLGAKTAIQTCTQLPDENLAVVALRLTFGGAPGPYEWGVISETVCDLATAILHEDEWSPANTCAPNSNLVPAKKIMSDKIPFGVGRELIVDVPVNPRGMADVYIDDTIGFCVDISDNDVRLENAILLAIHAAARPLHESEPIPREEMAALAKLLAEAGLEESKVILGLFFDFRRMLVSLPSNKHAAWSKDIENMIEKKETCFSDLDTAIGRLGNVGVIVCPIFHFLSRLRELKENAKNRRLIKISEKCLKDLRLMLSFLDLARDGIDLNLLAFRKPTHVYRSDSCPAGMGGYSHEGFAWRFYIPDHLQGRASNNLLEHIGCIVTPWIDMIAGRLGAGDCSLSMTDSSTSEGWQRKTNFKEFGEEPIQAEVRIDVAREDAQRRMDYKVKNYSQWFPGSDNDVSDALSRDDDRGDEELTNILRTFVPSQVPSHFKIVPLPNEISSWLTSLLLRLPVKEQLQEKHTRTKLGRGGDSENGAIPSVSSTTTTLKTSQEVRESASLEHLPWLCVGGGFQDQLMTPWLRAQSEVPSHLWHRPSGKMIGQTLQKTKTVSLDDFYRGNSEPSETMTPIQSNRKPSQSASSESC
jgi:hypothetical protein